VRSCLHRSGAFVIDGPKAKREKLYCTPSAIAASCELRPVVNDWNVVRDLPLDYVV
jgi:hypothetical protein